jgi:hypothetical protein
MSESNGKKQQEKQQDKRQRRQFTPEDKATILRRHLVDRVPVSDLCDEYKIQPTLFYLPPDGRDAVVDFVRTDTDRTELSTPMLSR